MEHKFLRLYIDGVWTGNADRTIRVNHVVHDLDQYAQEHGIQLPDSKTHKAKMVESKQKNKDKVNSYADMEQSLDSGDTEIDGDGNSES
mgnify:FL=1